MEHTSVEYALELDKTNKLARFRERFYQIPDIIYMDGNSLGLLSVDAEQSLLRVLYEWKTKGIGGWLNGKVPWFWFAEEMGAMASQIIGAEPQEVIMTGSTTINIHALVGSFYHPKSKRRKILADVLNFPSDIYALQSQVKLKGYKPADTLVLVEPERNGLLNERSIIEQMSKEVALIFLPSVLYRSGQLLDIQMLAKAANERNIPIGFDCSHSVGAVPHHFDTWGVDFALWCSYKYLNGGPGAAAFIYVNRKHFKKEPMLAGWFGYLKEKQFEMLNEFVPSPHAGRWQISSPGILGTAPVEGAMKIILEAGIENIREQSLKLTSYLLLLLSQKLIKDFPEFKIATPPEPEKRGGHIAVEHPEALRITEALKARGIIPDLRPPNVIRIAPVSLYNTFEETWRVVDVLYRIMQHREYERFATDKKLLS